MSAERICALPGCGKSLGDARKTRRYCSGACRKKACEARRAALTASSEATGTSPSPGAPVTVRRPSVTLSGATTWQLASTQDEALVERIRERHPDLWGA